MAETSHPEAPAEGFTQANIAPKEKGKPVYEVGFHLVPTVGEEGIGAAIEKIRTLLGDAEIIAEGYPQKLAFTYTIERSVAGKREKYSEGYFGWIKFATEREAIPALEAALLGTTEVLRSLIIETVREEIIQTPRRAVFTSDRLEGETLKKPVAVEEKAEVSEEQLDKSIDALVAEK